MNTASAPVIPPGQPFTPKPSRIREFSVLIALLVILILAGVLFFVRIQGDRLGKRIIEAVRLHDVILVSVTDTQPHLYSLGLFGLKDSKVSGTEGDVVEFAQGGSTEAYISRNSSTGKEDVIVLGSKKHVGASGSHVAGLAVSPSGNFIAYSDSTSGTQRLSDWNMHLYDSAGNREVALGVGYGAQFVTREGKEFLIFTNPKGIQFEALDTLDGFLTPFDITDSTFYAVKASPDGKYLATRDGARGYWGLLEITKLEIGFPIRMTPLHTDLSTLTSVSFVGGRLIGIEPAFTDVTHLTSSAVRIHALSLSNPDTASSTVVYTFPTTSLFVFNHL